MASEVCRLSYTLLVIIIGIGQDCTSCYLEEAPSVEVTPLVFVVNVAGCQASVRVRRG